MLEKRTSGGGVCVGGVAAYGRSQPADSTQHTAHRSGVDVDEVVDRSGGIASGGIACRRAVERSSSPGVIGSGGCFSSGVGDSCGGRCMAGGLGGVIGFGSANGMTVSLVGVCRFGSMSSEILTRVSRSRSLLPRRTRPGRAPARHARRRMGGLPVELAVMGCSSLPL